jgi:hypothetical protein
VKIKGTDRITIVANAMKQMTYYDQMMLAEMFTAVIKDATNADMTVDQIADALNGWARGYDMEE